MEDVTSAKAMFGYCLILECNVRVSKAGNPFCTLRFLDEDDYKVYDLMQFNADAVRTASALKVGDKCGLLFDIEPARDGGARLVLNGIGEYGCYPSWLQRLRDVAEMSKEELEG